MSRRAAVVGAGVGGMASALFLARSGWSVDLFERFETPAPLGAGLLLQPTGLCVLAALGLYKRIRGRGVRIERLHGETIRGRRIMDLPYAAYHPGYHGLGLHRGVLFEALFEAVDAEPEIRFSGAIEVEGVRQSDGQARLQWVLGETEPYDLAVAADGAGSALRAQMRVARRDRPYDWACLWTTAADPGGQLESPVSAVLDQRYDGVSRFAGILPIGPSREASARPSAALFWSIRTDAFESWREAGFDAWKAELAAFWPRFHAFIEPIDDPDQVTLAVYRDAAMSRPDHGRVVFVGDAGHAMSPQLGQGANLALLDAMALAEALAVDDDIAAGLRRFRIARGAQTRWYQRASRWLTPVFQSSRPLWGVGRNLLFSPISRIAWVKREMLAAQSGMKTGWFSQDRRDWTPGTHPPR